MDREVVFGIAEDPADPVCTESFREAWLDEKSVVAGFDPEKILGYGIPVPGCGSCQPAVFPFTRGRCILTCDHLTVDIGLDFVETLVPDIGRGDPAVMVPSVTRPSGKGLPDDDPGIVVAEYPGVFLIPLRIGRNLSVFDPV